MPNGKMASHANIIRLTLQIRFIFLFPLPAGIVPVILPPSQCTHHNQNDDYIAHITQARFDQYLNSPNSERMISSRLSLSSMRPMTCASMLNDLEMAMTSSACSGER